MVRGAIASDVDAILALAESTAEAPRWTEAQYRTMMMGEHSVLLVAIEEEALAGFSAASVIVGEAELESIAVDVQARRKGIGQALVAETMAWVARREGVLLRLEVRASNGAARGFYQSLGFDEMGVRKRYYSDPAEDAILMQRSVAK